MTSKYKLIPARGHPNAQLMRDQMYEHVFVMSEMLGRPLTAEEVVHHHNEDKGDNSPKNLQLFPTQAAHLRHHAEMKALEVSGDASFMKCRYCKSYDNPSNMSVSKTAYVAHHKACQNAYKAAAYITPEGHAKSLALTAKSRLNRKHKATQ